MALKRREEEKRNWGVSFRLNDEEYDTMISRMEEMGIEKKTEFMRTCIMDPKIVDREFIRRQLRDLKFQMQKMDSRLEQIFKNISTKEDLTGVDFSKFHLEEIMGLLERTEKLLWKLEPELK